MSYPGLLIVFEGIDGCGKGTQIELLAHELRKRGLGDKVVLFKQPGGTELGGRIREILFHSVTTYNMDPDAASLLYLSSFIQGVREVVIPALEAGKIVISDRWDPYSGTAFGRHGLARPVSFPVECLRDQVAIELAPEPDLTFLLYGDPDALLRRALGRRSEDHQAGKVWSNIPMLERIQNEYYQLMPESTWLKVDQNSPEDIFGAVWHEVEPHVERFNLIAAA